jgi:citrate lyase subunit beta/citryl-CoA lyase
MIRSFLFAPGDSERKMQKALDSGAHALILDLEDSVAPESKPVARGLVAAFLQRTRGRQEPRRYVRINDLKSGMTLADLAAIVPHAPDGVVLPKCLGGPDVRQVQHYLDALETASFGAPTACCIVAIATESAEGLLNARSYKDCSPRLYGLMWGAEDLSADLGAKNSREGGEWTPVFELARSACLLGSAAAGVAAIDTVFADIGDQDGLRHQVLAAKRDGFACKAAIHPDQVRIINEGLAPTAEELGWAERVVAAMNDQGGVARVDGRMVDLAHLKLARRILGA